MNKPLAWTEKDLRNACRNARLSEDDFFRIKAYLPIDTHPVKELTDEDVRKNGLCKCMLKEKNAVLEIITALKLLSL